ncbi:MAG: hypothetical protein R2752_02150 [Vicinamibacterales bacterium]
MARRLAIVLALLSLTAFVQVPADWDQAHRQALTLRAAGDPTRAAGVLEQFLLRSPDFGPAHFELAETYAEAARTLTTPDAVANRRGRLETAAEHYRRALALDPLSRPGSLVGLVRVYGEDELNEPAQAEPFARQLVSERPRSVVWHVGLARILDALGRAGEASRVLHDAAAKVQGDDRVTLAMTVTQRVAETPALAGADVTLLLDDSLAIVADELRRTPDRRDLYMVKTLALQLQADRVERDPARQRALKAQSDAAFDRFSELGRAERGAAGGGVQAAAPSPLPPAPPPPPPPPPPPSGGADTPPEIVAPSDYVEVVMRAEPLITTGKAAEAAAIYREFVAAHPAYAGGHCGLVGALVSAGSFDAAGRAVTDARTAVPRTPPARDMLGGCLTSVARGRPALTAAQVRPLLAAAVDLLDEALALRADFVDALGHKAQALREQATRVETDPARAKALIDEAARLEARAKAIRLAS